MKTAVNSARVIVGILFIFSGLVKANDPAGLSYKMHEFFEAWGMSSLNGMALTFSVLMNVFEIVAGVALLIGWRIRLISWLLLALMVFFTFLTGYAWLSGKFKSCGCFGDCIPLNPKQSFFKDLILLGLIVFMMVFQKYIRPLFNFKISLAVLAVAVLASFGIQKYTLDHLPFKDCLSFKIGNNLAEKRKFVAGKKEITMVYKKDGKEYSFSYPNYPTDTTYVWLRREEVELSKGNEGDMIIDFSLRSMSGTDTTTDILNQPYRYCFYFINQINEDGKASWNERFTELVTVCRKKNIPVYIVTNMNTEANRYFNIQNKWNLPVFFCDEKPILAAARTRPCLYVINKAVIENKWSYKDLSTSIRTIEKLSANE
jgi:uncharacterized membrane protein YphA (DoxX/SURF4 family)